MLQIDDVMSIEQLIIKRTDPRCKSLRIQLKSNREILYHSLSCLLTTFNKASIECKLLHATVTSSVIQSAQVAPFLYTCSWPNKQQNHIQ